MRVVFDDFGTGYASLSYLKKFPLDGLKIDRSFVLDLRADSDDAAIVGSTVGLSKQLGLSVIAEGIENRATADLLVSMGCEEGQGYFFGRPMPAQAFEEQFLKVREPAARARSRGRLSNGFALRELQRFNAVVVLVDGALPAPLRVASIFDWTRRAAMAASRVLVLPVLISSPIWNCHCQISGSTLGAKLYETPL